MTLLTNKTTGDTVTASEWNEAAVSCNRVNAKTGAILDENDLQKPLINLLSTGILTPGHLLSINGDPTKFNISAFTAQIVDNSNPLAPVYTKINYAGATAVTATYLSVSPVTYIGINSAGTIVQSPTPFSITERRTLAHVGALIHVAGTVIELARTGTSSPGINSAANFEDISSAMGLINVSGNIYSANPVNTLKLNKSAGETFNSGINWGNNILSPNNTTDPSGTNISFTYVWRDGAGDFNTIVTDTINPSKYDDGTGGLTQPNGALASNKWQLMKIYWSPITQSSAIEYGQVIYNSAAEAEAARSVATIDYPILTALQFRGWLVVRGGATNLNSTADGIFIQADKFGQTTSGVGSGSSTTTLQGAYNNSTTPEIVTDVTRDGLTLRNGYGTDVNNVLEIQNLAATTTMSISADGDLHLNKTITTPGVTGNQTINKTAGSVNFGASASTLTVTNSLVTTSSVIVATVATNDTTMKSVNVVQSAGSFVLNANAAATAETRVNFVVFN